MLALQLGELVPFERLAMKQVDQLGLVQDLKLDLLQDLERDLRLPPVPEPDPRPVPVPVLVLHLVPVPMSHLQEIERTVRAQILEQDPTPARGSKSRSNRGRFPAAKQETDLRSVPVMQLVEPALMAGSLRAVHFLQAWTR